MLASYQPSGKISPLSLVALPLLVPCAVAAAWLYVFLLDLIPLVYLELFIVFGFAGAIGVLVTGVMRATKCRNPAVAIAAGLIVAASGLAASHYFAYTSLHYQAAKQLGHALPRMLTVSQYIKLRTDAGWTIGHGVSSTGSGLQINGFMVWVVWALEAVIIMGGGVAGAKAVLGVPFCEACGQWANRMEAQVRVERPTPESIEQVKNGTTVVELLDVTSGGTARQELVYNLLGCPKCRELPTLTVRFKETVTRKNKDSTITRTLHRNVLLTETEAQTVREMDTEGIAAGVAGTEAAAAAAVAASGPQSPEPAPDGPRVSARPRIE
jgi:hypothetical protein